LGQNSSWPHPGGRLDISESTCANGSSQAEPGESPILHAAIALAPKIRASGEEIEQARRIPTSIVQAMTT